MVCATLIYIVNRGYKAASDWWSPHSRTNKCCFCGSSWPKKSRHLPPPVPPRRCHKPWTCGTPGTLGWPICSISAATETPIDRLYGVILPGMWGIIMIWLVVWNIFFSPYIGNNHPNWLSYFSEVYHQPVIHELGIRCSTTIKGRERVLNTAHIMCTFVRQATWCICFLFEQVNYHDVSTSQHLNIQTPNRSVGF